MRQRDWFEVGVRLFGVWVLIDLVNELRYMFAIKFGFMLASMRFEAYLMHSIVDAAVGVYLLFYATHLSRMIYGPDSQPGGFDVTDPNPEEGR